MNKQRVGGNKRYREEKKKREGKVNRRKEKQRKARSKARDREMLSEKEQESQSDRNRERALTILASECVVYAEWEPLLPPPRGGPGMPGMLGTMCMGRASWRQHTRTLTT